MSTVSLFLEKLSRLVLWLSGGALVAMTAIIFIHVFCRYALRDSIAWGLPSSEMVMAWFILLGAAVGIREGNHLSFDVLLHFLPDPVVKLLHSVSDLVVGAFGCGMIWFGAQLMIRKWDTTLPALRISGAYESAPLVIGGVLIVLFSLERLARRMAGLPTARFGDIPEEE